MKYKYALFAYSGESECGGMNDLQLKFNSKYEVKEWYEAPDFDVYQLVFLEDMESVELKTTWLGSIKRYEQWKEEEKQRFMDWIEELIMEDIV
ncbi:hypothetical protein [Paenibacillus sp. USHLN196]|uniref:hypothetical protein n=1 Tax=Paenibacillus sp. USHLN196 TaxID=3081291 RepID=UPI003016EDEC